MKTLSYIQDKALAKIVGGLDNLQGNGPFAGYIFRIVNAEDKDERELAIDALRVAIALRKDSGRDR